MGAAIKAEGPSAIGGVAGCNGKRAYPNHAAAEKEGRLVSAKNRRKKNRVYHCKVCGMFHYGSLPQSFK